MPMTHGAASFAGWPRGLDFKSMKLALTHASVRFPRNRPGGPPYEFRRIHGSPVDFTGGWRWRLGVLETARAPSDLLSLWAATHAPRFEIVSALKARRPNKQRRLNGVKQAIECPFEDEHSEAGGEGTIAVNASQVPAAGLTQIYSGFFLHCSHNACAYRDRLGLLAGMVAQGWLTEGDLIDLVFQSERAAHNGAGKRPAMVSTVLAVAEVRVFLKTMTRGPSRSPLSCRSRQSRHSMLNYSPTRCGTMCSMLLIASKRRPTLRLLRLFAGSLRLRETASASALNKHDDWEVVPNMWGAIIGRPSAMKSPAMRSALAPLYAIQDSLKKDWEGAQREADIEAALSGLDAKEAAKNAAKAIKGGDREEAKRLLSQRANDNGETPCPRLIVNDATVEKLGELLNENPHGLLLIRDELPGFLAKMESEEYQSERAFYLEAYNGDGKFTYDRIGRGTIPIENCTLSIIGGIQPARIAPLVHGAANGISDDGLIQRLQLTVWPDDIGSWTWTDRHPDAAARERYDAAFRGLHDFARGFETPAIFGFSSAAQDMFKQWMTGIQAEARGGKLPSVLESHLLKMPKTVAALALVFELVGRGPWRGWFSCHGPRA